MIQQASLSQAIIADFDSLEQLRLWFLRGPQEAIRQYVGYLRLGLLAADCVYVDRAQLLDGIVFLALGPQGVARALGLNSQDTLPLVVGGTSSLTGPKLSDGVVSISPSARLSSLRDLRKEWVREQVSALHRAGFVSAAEYAWELTAMRFGLEKDALPPHEEDHSVHHAMTLSALRLLYEPLSDCSQEGVDKWEIFSSPYVAFSRFLEPDFIRRSRKEWEEALVQGRATLTQWPTLDTKGWPLWENYFPGKEKSTFRHESGGALRSEEVKEQLVSRIAQRVFGIQCIAEPSMTSVSSVNSVSSGDEAGGENLSSFLHQQQEPGDTHGEDDRRSSKGVIATRSDLVLFLAAQCDVSSYSRVVASTRPLENKKEDHEAVLLQHDTQASEFRQPGEPPLFDESEEDAALMHARACIRWWSKRQYEALFAQDSPFPHEPFAMRRLNFNTTELVPTAQTSTSDADRLRNEVEKAWGLSEPAPGRWQRIWRNISPRTERFAQSDELHIDGNILDELCVMDAHYYRLLLAHPLVAANVGNNEKNRGAAASQRALSPEGKKKRRQTAEDWRNIALAVKDIHQEPLSWKHRTQRGLRRAVLLFFVALLVTAGDAGLLTSWGSWTIWGIPLLAFISSLPWGELKELWDLRPGAMSTTLEVQRERQSDERAVPGG